MRNKLGFSQHALRDDRDRHGRSRAVHSGFRRSPLGHKVITGRAVSIDRSKLAAMGAGVKHAHSL